MASLISQADKDAIEAIFNDIHDTFARDLYVYKQPATTVISPSLDYNGLYNNVQGNKTIQNNPQIRTFKARIKYLDTSEETTENVADLNSQLQVQRPIQEVRIKIDKAGYEYIKDSKRVELDGRRFVINRDVVPHGVFSPNYYNVYLRAADKEEN
tara:strand:- start:2974 stop:3438 length:465 start_codon:yes stop_codon:yes gene_type:complete